MPHRVGVIRITVLCAALLAVASEIRAQGRTAIDQPRGNSTINVHVQEAGGGPLSVPSEVKLFTQENPLGQVKTTGIGGAVSFSGMAPGTYVVELVAAGYKPAREEVMVVGDAATTQVFLTMYREGSVTPEQKQKNTSGPPLLVGKSRKELDLAISALKANKSAEAVKHVDYALKHAPGNPDVQYIAAMIALGNKDDKGARQYLEAAVSVYPAHFGAQTGLGMLLLQQGHAADAIPHLEKATELDPTSWRSHWLVAEAYLRSGGDLSKAKTHAARAVELGKEKAGAARIVLAIAQGRSGEMDAARAGLERFLRELPQDPEAPRARSLLASANNFAAQAATAAAGPALAVVNVPPPERLPSGIDDLVPPVEPGVACSAEQVLEGAARRATELTDSVQRFSATEGFIHDELDATGVLRSSYRDSFSYLAELKWPRTDLMILKEMRNGSFAPPRIPALVLTDGLPAIGMVFHPAHAKNFSFKCEGLGHWHGQPAWQVRFQQRDDRRPQLHNWEVGGRPYDIFLKGRAWISASSYQVLRVETDLVKPLPEIHLDLQHMTIEYAPVRFAQGKTELWLPSTAEVYTQYKGRFFRQQHDFSNFTLFNVDSQQKIHDPVDK